MLLVDTSVLIGFLKGNSNYIIKMFKEVLWRKIPYSISALTLQEVLQGARNERDFTTLKEYLSTQEIYYLKQELWVFEKAARMYYEFRREGVTPSTIDILIALTAIENKLFLLHDDRDFDLMADKLPDLRTLQAI